MVWRPSVAIRRPQYSNIISETARPIKAKFCVGPLWVGLGGGGGAKNCCRHLSHMTKMAATIINGKNPSKIFPGTSRPISTKPGMQHQELEPIIVCSKDGPGLTFSYFTERSNLVTWVF